MTIIEALMDKARTQDTQTIFECVVQLATVNDSTERMVRAALIQVYQERTSPEQADALMDLIGL